MAAPDMTTPSPTENLFLEKKFLEKRDAHVHQLRRKLRQVPLPDKGIGGGGTTFTIAADCARGRSLAR
jgi:hypothetical protein